MEIVEEANRAVFERAADPDLRGMGTTLVALTLRPGEGKVSIVNVGDSRAYFFRAGQFSQLTRDHSLVEDLVIAGKLTPEEALTHPQRNILTRALGIASEVEVDRFLQDVELADRFLLCSDGLFNEVSEEEIVQILDQCPEPNEAADALVREALSRTARDNVTVAVVDVVNDGEGGDVSSAPPEALQIPSPPVDEITLEAPVTPDEAPPPDPAEETPPAAPGPDGEPGQAAGHDGGFDPNVTAAVMPSQPNDDTLEAPPPMSAPAPGAAPGGGEYDEDFGHGASADDTAPLPAGGYGAGPNGGVGLDLAEPEVALQGDDYDEDDDGIIESIDTIELPELAPRRGSRVRQILFGLVVLAVLASVAYFGGTFYARSTYYVDVEEGGVLAIYNGRPGFPLVDPTRELGIGDKTYDALDEASQARVDDQELHGSLAEAQQFVDSLNLNVEPDDLVEATEAAEEADTSVTSDDAGTTDTTETSGAETTAPDDATETTAPQAGSAPAPAQSSSTTEAPSTPTTSGT